MTQRIVFFTLLVLVTAGLVACSSPSATPTPVPLPTSTPPTATPPEETVAVPDLGLQFTVPDGWERQGTSWIWVSTVSATQRLGVNFAAALPGREPESILPGGGVVLGREEGPVLSWGTAATYELQILTEGGQGQIRAWERHVLVRSSDSLSDWFAGGSSEAELAAASQALTTLLSSVTILP